MLCFDDFRCSGFQNNYESTIAMQSGLLMTYTQTLCALILFSDFDAIWIPYLHTHTHCDYTKTKPTLLLQSSENNVQIPGHSRCWFWTDMVSKCLTLIGYKLVAPGGRLRIP